MKVSLGSGLLLLHEQMVECLLEVEVGELLVRTETKKGTKRSIRDNLTLIIRVQEIVSPNVRVNLLGNIRTTELRSIRLIEEGTKLLSDTHRRMKSSGLAGRRGTLSGLPTTSLTSLLEDTLSILHKALHPRRHLLSEVSKGLLVGTESLKFSRQTGSKSLNLRNGGSSGSRSITLNTLIARLNGGSNNLHRGGNSCGRSSLLLHTLLLSRSSSGNRSGGSSNLNRGRLGGGTLLRLRSNSANTLSLRHLYV
jgi:hypothetical protein